MSADRDYIVGVGLALADDSIEAVSAEIQKALARIPPLQLKVTGIAELDRLASTLQSVTSNSSSTTAAVSRTTSAFQQQADAERAATKAASDLQRSQAAYSRDSFNDQVRLNNELERSLNLFSRMNESANRSSTSQGVSEGRKNFPASADSYNSELFSGSNVDDLINRGRGISNAVNSVFATMANEIDKANAQEETLSRAISRMGSGQGASDTAALDESTRAAANYVVQMNAANDAITRNNDVISRNIGQVQAAAAAHEQLRNIFPPEVTNVRGLTDEFAHQIGTFATWSIAARTFEGALNLVTKSVNDSIAAQKEQTLQSLYYGAQGKEFTPAMSSEAMNQSIALARLYGDDIMHVQESVGLWAKQSKGELEPALAMTNQAMKLNAISGMSMEEIYKATVGIMSQTHDSYSRQIDLYNIATGEAERYGGALQSLEGQNDDMVKNMVEGMDKSSAVFARSGLQMEQMGAAVAIVSQDMNMLGSEVGTHLARAFAQMQEGKLRETLHGIGIETQNNIHFIQDLQRVFPTHGAQILQQIKPADKEAIDTLLSNAKQYAQALQVAKKAEQDNAADQAFQKVMTTTSFQIKQLQIGIEAFGITLAREFNPQIKGTVDLFLNLLPVALQWSRVIASLIGTGSEIALWALAFNVVRSAVGFAARSFNEFYLAANAMTPAQIIMSTSLSNVQRSLLATATVNGEVSAELETSIKTVAAQTGQSVDAIILDYMRMSGVISKTAGQVEIDAAAMDAAIATMARDAGISATSVEGAESEMATGMVAAEGGVATSADGMKASFNSIAATAETDAAATRLAWAKAIPVIGTVVTTALIAKGAIDAANSAADSKELDKLRTDPGYLRTQEFSAHEKLNQAQTWTQQDSSPWMGLLGPAGAARSLGDKWNLDSANHELDLISQVRSGSLGSSGSSAYAKTVQALMDAAAAREKKEQAELAKMYASEGKPATDAMPAVAGSKGPSAASQTATALKQVEAENAKILSQDAAKVTADQAAIERAKAALMLNDLSAASIQKLGNAYNREAADLQKQIRDLTASQKTAQSEYNTLIQKAQAAGGAHTTSGKSYLDQAATLENRISSTTKQIAGLQKALSSLNDTHKATVIEFQHQLALGNTQGMLDQYKAIESTLKSLGKNATAQDLSSAAAFATKYADTLEKIAHNYESMGSKGAEIARTLDSQAQSVRENASAWTSRGQALQQNADQIDQRLISSLQDQAIEMHTPYDANVQDAFKQMLELERQYTTDMQALKAANDTAGQAALQMWYNNQQQIIQNKLALSEYNQELQTLKSTTLYQAFSGAVDSAGSTLASSFVDSVDGTTATNNQITALQGQVTMLENERNLLVGQYYDTQRTQITNEVNELNERIKELQDVEKDPSLGKKLVEDLTKGLADGFMKQLEDELKQSLLDQFIPKLDKSTQTQQQTMDQFSKTVNGQFKNSFDQWQQGIDKGVPAMNNLADQLKNFSNGTVTSNDGTPVGAVQGFNDVMDGDTPVNFNANSNAGGGGGVGGYAMPIVAGAAALAAFSGAKVPIGGGTGYVNADGSVGGGDVFNVSDPYGAIDESGQFPVYSGSVNLPQYTASAGGSLTMLQRGMNAVGDLGMAYAGFQTGGVAGGLETGLGSANFMSSIAGMFTGGAAGAGGIGQLLGAASPYVGIAMGLISMFTHHDNPALMPDKYDTQDYGQTIADMIGSGYGGPGMEANGTPFSENATLASSLGNQGELSYIAQFITNNPTGAKQVLTPQELAMFTGLKQGGAGIINGKNGMEELGNGQWVQWQQLASSVQAAVSAIQQFTDSANQASQPLIAIQAFGAGMAQGFSPYYTPGFGNYYSDYMKNTPYYAYNASPTNPVGGSTSNGATSPSVTQNGNRIQVTSNLVLGGRTIAQIIQNLEARMNTAGWVHY